MQRQRNAKLALAMFQRNITGQKLARKAKVHPTTVSQALNGRVRTSPETAKRFAKILKSTPQKLGLVFEEVER